MNYNPTSVNDYFALKKSSECVSVCEEFIEEFYNEAEKSGRLGLYRTSFFSYFEGYMLRGMMARGGQQGEQTMISVNNYHNFIKHRVNQTCQQKLSYEPQTLDGSHAAMEQVRLAKGLLNLYSERSDIDLDGKLRKSVELSEIFGESFVSTLWDKGLGKPVAFDFINSQQIPEGDIEVAVFDPLAVVRDTSRTSPDQHEWYILRQEKNKVNLAVEYPHFESEIMGQTIENHSGKRNVMPTRSRRSDLVYVWTFFHKNTLAVPKGRKTVFIDENLILEDGQLPEEFNGELPIHRMASEDMHGTSWGYSDTFEALPICRAISRLHSTVLTNNVTFGLQHILVPRDGQYNEATLATGLTVLEWDAAKGANYRPQPLNLTQSSPETYNYINTLTQTVGTLMGINEVTRGNPDLVLKGQASGSALALMSTQSIQFNDSLAKGYQNLASRVGSAIIEILKVKSVIPRDGRVISMSGKSYSKKFKKDDLDRVNKVIVKTGNPLSKTTSGKLQIADALFQGGFLKNRQDYIQVMETGNLDPLLESYDMQISLIKDENDSLLNGPLPPALVIDNHTEHIAEHSILLSSVESRQNPDLVKNVLAHIQSHLDNLAGNAQHGPMNPILATIGNQPALPQNSPDGIFIEKPQPQIPSGQPSFPGKVMSSGGLPFPSSPSSPSRPLSQPVQGESIQPVLPTSPLKT